MTKKVQRRLSLSFDNKYAEQVGRLNCDLTTSTLAKLFDLQEDLEQSLGFTLEIDEVVTHLKLMHLSKKHQQAIHYSIPAEQASIPQPHVSPTIEGPQLEPRSDSEGIGQPDRKDTRLEAPESDNKVDDNSLDDKSMNLQETVNEEEFVDAADVLGVGGLKNMYKFN
ncbi:MULTISPECIES: hypothetical protein [Vibrio]|uniref:Uncharacterized protein n=1 Tax=Vibrio tasmaniensis TaxID=212663 RepID=A0A2N7NNA5_9VIBR|nr:hypothetical protein [Vibrio tasmaniensis]PMO80343.1 hypothetical protein BCT01_08610 [Vibrio tasmaniensis]PMP17789.1 hypothetical protein BCS92_05120 [Vibrio tasmaniensis]TKG28994.1 hypothetical protein FC057_20120 [Vibrio tasmaniensis]TKG41607.1 hypothetical protein FC063_07030 [Vibrio tasmaniensis]TKG46256.1 hypothetical protein FC070_22495 [Vibrio tasmaniensis]